MASSVVGGMRPQRGRGGGAGLPRCGVRVLKAPTSPLPVAIHLPVFDEKTHQPKFIGTYSPHPTKEGYLMKVSDEGDGPSEIEFQGLIDEGEDPTRLCARIGPSGG